MSKVMWKNKLGWVAGSMVAVALLISGCGIKGPLTLPPDTERNPNTQQGTQPEARQGTQPDTQQKMRQETR